MKYILLIVVLMFIGCGSSEKMAKHVDRGIIHVEIDENGKLVEVKRQ